MTSKIRSLLETMAFFKDLAGKQPEVQCGPGALARLWPELKRRGVTERVSHQGTYFLGVEFRESAIMPDNMAVLTGANGETVILDLRTEEEKRASETPQISPQLEGISSNVLTDTTKISN